MDNKEFAANAQEGVALLLELAAAYPQNIAETPDQFDAVIMPSVDKLEKILTSLQPFTSVATTKLEYTINNEIEGSADLVADGLQAKEWPGEFDPEESELDPFSADIITALLSQLSPDQPPLPISAFCAAVTPIVDKGVPFDPVIYVNVNKEEIAQRLAGHDSAALLCYLIAGNFIEYARGSTPTALAAELLPDPKQMLVLLLGDVTGVGKGPNLAIWGIDQWQEDDLARSKSAEMQKDIAEIVAFRREECQWEAAASALTPYHLHLQTSTLDHAAIAGLFDELRDALCVPYLANRSQEIGAALHCEIRGQKRVPVILPSPGVTSRDDALYHLFDWAYENHSSDKLGIVRQILSLSLGEEEDKNYALLQRRSKELLGTAKSNFQLFLKRSVELYFDKRMRVSEYLQQFAQAVSEEISNLTSEMVSNLYKTVGLIIGAVIASLIEPGKVPQIVALSAGLYFFYVLFITLYQLPAIYIRYQNKRKEYDHGIAELRDILAEEELKNLQGTTFQDADQTFTIYFFATAIIYIILALLAIAIMGITLIAS